MSGQTEILKKWAEVKDTVGSRRGDPVDEGYGGLRQECAHGNIYWHKNTGAHEVHGGILRKYLSHGGPGEDPDSGDRLFGFPTSDEYYFEGSGDPMSEFEWANLHWVHGGVAVLKPFLSDWKAHLGEMLSRLPEGPRPNDPRPLYPDHPIPSFPIWDTIPVPGGHVQYFRRAIWYKGDLSDGHTIGFRLSQVPRLGRPWILQRSTYRPQKLVLDMFIPEGLEDRVPDTEDPFGFLRRRDFRTLLLEAFRNRLLIRMVGGSDAQIPLHVQVEKDRGRYALLVDASPGTHLNDRTLFDLVFCLPGGDPVTLQHHAVYLTEKKWTDFGFIHATDLHVARRDDGFREKLEALGHGRDPAWVNFNDGLRDLIRYANQLHDKGTVDFIVVTGDITDYQFELYDLDPFFRNWRAAGREDDPKLPERYESDLITYFQQTPMGSRKEAFRRYNNFIFFRRLLCGDVTSGSGEGDEALRVPVFATLGNHDYRRAPYPLDFRIELPVVDDVDAPQYEAHNLIRPEAVDLQGGNTPKCSSWFSTQLITPGAIREQTNSEVPKDSYVVGLGPHRLVMLNTGSDKDVLDSTGEAVSTYFGFSSEHQSEFKESRPRSEGLDESDLKLVKSVLNDAGDSEREGLVILGMHAPPVQPYEYPPYFRETEHPEASAGDLVGYLARREQSQYRWDEGTGEIWGPHVSNHSMVRQDPEQILALMSRWKREWGSPNSRYFKRGSIDHYLDKCIAVGKAEDLLKVCVGKGGVNRKADLVLCGHVHKDHELRWEWDEAEGEMLFFTDFYTENPSEYYSCMKFGVKGPVHVEVDHDGVVGGPIVNRTDPAEGAKWKEWKALIVPPYGDPLCDEEDKQDWWMRHRPLLVQTACLGPTDSNQRREKDEDPDLNEAKPGPRFQGFRVVIIKDDFIDSIHRVTLDELRNNNFEMPWEVSRRRLVRRDEITTDSLPSARGRSG